MRLIKLAQELEDKYKCDIGINIGIDGEKISKKEMELIIKSFNTLMINLGLENNFSFNYTNSSYFKTQSVIIRINNIHLSDIEKMISDIIFIFNSVSFNSVSKSNIRPFHLETCKCINCKEPNKKYKFMINTNDFNYNE